MGLLGFDSDDQQPTRLSQLCLDSVKLPVVDKPQWIGEIEIGLLGATPLSLVYKCPDFIYLTDQSCLLAI